MNETGAAQEVEPVEDGKSLILKNRIRAIVYGCDARIATTAYEALNTKVQDLIECAAQRAKANGRVTIMPQDF